VQTRFELLGKTLRESELHIPRAALARAAREVRYPRLATYVGIATLLLGSYALTWGRSDAQQAEVVAVAAEESSVGGLEVPWTGSLALADELRTIRPDWQFVVTSLPGTLTHCATQPGFGLASIDPEGRGAALADAARLRMAIASINDSLGRAAVSAVEFHSAPTPQDMRSARSALARSLDWITGWDWGGAQILLEHVDAKVADHAPAKGFLSLEDEIEVIGGNSLPVGILINWGRSAIELRSAARVVDHVAMARQAGVLRGLIFSGVSAVASDYGGPWADQHLPPTSHERGSLLTAELMDDALSVAGPLDYTGVKMSWHGPSLRDGTLMLLSTARMVSAMSVRYAQTIP